MLSKLAYLTLCRSVQLLTQLARGDAAKDLEILVLRRQTPRPRLEPADRALLAAISRVLPRTRWSCFFVKPETLLRWHRRLFAGGWGLRWTYPGRGPGRGRIRAGIASVAKGHCCASGYRSQHRRSERPSTVMDSTPSRVAQPRRGGRSCASRPSGSSPATSSPSTPSGLVAALREPSDERAGRFRVPPHGRR